VWSVGGESVLNDVFCTDLLCASAGYIGFEASHQGTLLDCFVTTMCQVVANRHSSSNGLLGWKGEEKKREREEEEGDGRGQTETKGQFLFGLVVVVGAPRGLLHECKTHRQLDHTCVGRWVNPVGASHPHALGQGGRAVTAYSSHDVCEVSTPYKKCIASWHSAECALCYFVHDL
jgi:hypothetical protein